MAKLSDFLGSLVSSICDARVNSDAQSLRIAEEYAKNDLLKHFSVPRMRIDKVELSIPVAVDTLSEKTQRIYQPIDNSSFAIKAYYQVLKSLDITDVPSDVSKKLISVIADHIHLLEANVKAREIDDSLEKFSREVALKTIVLTEELYKANTGRRTTKAELAKLQANITNDLQSALEEEISVKQDVKVLDAVHFIVEADKLRDIKPENVIMIKMTVSEQGMEWVKMEDKEGKVVSKLMPE